MANSIVWKNGQVDRYIDLTPGATYDIANVPSWEDLADALDECVATLLEMQHVYIAAPANDASRRLMIVRDECLRKIGVEQ